MNYLVEVRELLAEIWQLTPFEVPDDAALNVFEKWDSLGHISIILALEARYGIPVNEETIQNLSSLPKITAFLESHTIQPC